MPIDHLLFDDFSPDRSDFELNGCELVENLVSYGGRWVGWSRVNLHGVVSNTTLQAQQNPNRGGGWALRDGFTYVAAGANLHVIPYLSSSVKTGPSGAQSQMMFTAHGGRTVATAIGVPVQSSDGGTFADLFTSTYLPQARYCCSCRSRLIIAHTNDAGGQYRIAWSARNDPENMDPGPLSSDPGFVDVESDLGVVVGLAGFDDFFLSFHRYGVERWSLVGGERVWRRKKIAGSGDTLLGGGLTQSEHDQPCVVGRDCYYLSRGGFRKIENGEAVIPLGAGRVDHWLFGIKRHQMPDSALRISSAYSPAWKCVLWGVGNTTDRDAIDYPPIVCYSVTDDRFSVISPSDLAGAGVTFSGVLAVEDRDNEAVVLPAYGVQTDGPDTLLWQPASLGEDAWHNFRVVSRTVRLAGAESALAELLRARPIYRLDGSATLKLLIEYGEDPLMRPANTRSTVLTSAATDRQHFFQETESGDPLPATGTYHRFTVYTDAAGGFVAPGGPDERGLLELPGVEYEWEPAGRGG